VCKGSGKGWLSVGGGVGQGGENGLRLVHEYSSRLINRRNPKVGSENARATLRDGGGVRMKTKRLCDATPLQSPASPSV